MTKVNNLVLADLVAVCASLVVAVLLRGTVSTTHALQVISLIYILFAPITLSLYYVFGCYDPKPFSNKIDWLYTLINIVIAQAINAMGLVIIFYIGSDLLVVTPKTILLTQSVLAVLFLFANRMVFSLQRSKKYHATIAIYTDTQKAEELKKTITDQFSDTYTVLIHPNIENVRTEDILIYDTAYSLPQQTLTALRSLVFSGVQVMSYDAFYEKMFKKVSISSVTDEWFLLNVFAGKNSFYDILKRLFDIALALLLLPIYILSIPFVWLAIKLEDGGPVWITQERVGKKNTKITIYKYRSMTDNQQGKWAHEGEQRITRVGAIIRALRIDELPQLINIIQGTISFIGPRPDLTGLYERCLAEIPFYESRVIIQPGLTGWAQTTQAVVPQSIEETRDRLAYDLYYIKNKSFVLDLVITLKTVRTILKKIFK